MKREELVNYWIRMGYKALTVLVILFIFWKLRQRYSEWKKRRQTHKRFQQAQAEIQKKAAEIIPKITKEPRLADHVRKIADDTPKELAKVIKTLMVE